MSGPTPILRALDEHTALEALWAENVGLRWRTWWQVVLAIVVGFVAGWMF